MTKHNKKESNMYSKTHTQPWGLTVLRIVTGIIFLMHGWQKITVFGLEGFTGFLSQLGIPGASVAAVIVIAIELLGGLALILGLGTRYVAIPLAIDMLVALFTVHLSAGFFVGDGGYEFVLILLAASVALSLAGGGALALDNIVRERRGTAPVAEAT
jgi:putative oxidoreductase